jgi:hypothetical protein
MQAEGRDPGHGALQPRDPSSLRVSDADRHQVAEVLREAAGEGRLDLDELDERLEAAYRAKTYADLVPITADLPVRPATAPLTSRPAPLPATAGPRYETSIAIMSETKRVGSWQVEDGHTAFALMGSVRLDLRQASFAAREVTITANAVMGEVKIVVDSRTVVVVEGLGVMGEFQEQRPRAAEEVTPDSPVLRVKGLALMGSVTVQRRGAPASARKRLGPSPS